MGKTPAPPPGALAPTGDSAPRSSLARLGRRPTPAETTAFLADKRDDRREKLIDRCLDDKDFAAYWALRWGSILRNSQLAGSEAAGYAFHNRLRDMIARNPPFDAFVPGAVAPSGQWQDAPAANSAFQMRDPTETPPGAPRPRS